MSLPSWFEEHRKKQNARSKSQELDHARRMGGRVQPGSGSSPRARGDVRSEEFLDELKYTDKASYSLKVDTLKKVFDDAIAQDREGRMIIEFSAHGITVVVTRL
jgi:hypothetical protein